MKFEYMMYNPIYSPSDAEPLAELNDFGLLGWEVVSFTKSSLWGAPGPCLMKRKISERPKRKIRK